MQAAIYIKSRTNSGNDVLAGSPKHFLNVCFSVNIICTTKICQKKSRIYKLISLLFLKSYSLAVYKDPLKRIDFDIFKPQSVACVGYQRDCPHKNEGQHTRPIY